MQERFLPVPGFPMYEVSDRGRIRRISWADGRAWPPRYKKIKLGGNLKLCDSGRNWETCIARVMLITFVGPPSFPEAHARHLDDDRSNNKLENLAWGSAQDNADDKVRNGGTTKGLPHPPDVRRKIGLAHRSRKYSDSEIEHCRAMARSRRGKCLTEAHRKKIGAGVRRFRLTLSPSPDGPKGGPF